MISSDAHVHLRTIRARPAWDWARWPTFALGAGGAALFGVSLIQAWWSFWLYAPQYPNGLKLDIYLTGMGGDVHEIDLLNHYIGMAHLADAAPVERRLAYYGVAAIAAISLGLVTAAGKRLNRFIAIPAIAFPVTFLADSVAWLYSFGHHLNPHAPLKMGPFTPQMFGNGKIGQFETFAQPAIGFWSALAGVLCILAAVVIRSRVCAGCADSASCRGTCSRLLVLPGKEDR